MKAKKFAMDKLGFDLYFCPREGFVVEVRLFQSAVEKLNTLEPVIYCIAEAELDETWQGEAYSLPYNRMYLVESGSGMMAIDDEEVEMRPGMVYLVPAGAPLRYRCNGYMKKSFVHFNLLRPDQYDIMDGFGQICQVPLPPQLHEQLRRGGSGSTIAHHLLVKQSIYELLSLFLEQYPMAAETMPSYCQHVTQTIAYIRTHLSAKLRVEDLAKRQFVSRSYLAEVFRKEVGVPMGQYIDDQVMRAALLRRDKTKDRIQDISEDLGFGDQCYFARWFKKSQGVTPTQHRRQNQMPCYSSCILE